jgi:hypothetical protein
VRAAGAGWELVLPGAQGEGWLLVFGVEDLDI